MDVVDPVADPAGFERLLVSRLQGTTLSVIVARRPCILAAADIRRYDQMNAAVCSGACTLEEV